MAAVGEAVATFVAPVAVLEGGLALRAGRVSLEPHAQLRVDLRRTELLFPDDSARDLVPIALSFGLAVRLAGRDPGRQ